MSHKLHYVKSSEPKFIQQFKERVGMKKSATVDDKVNSLYTKYEQLGVTKVLKMLIRFLLHMLLFFILETANSNSSNMTDTGIVQTGSKVSRSFICLLLGVKLTAF